MNDVSGQPPARGGAALYGASRGVQPAADHGRRGAVLGLALAAPVVIASGSIRSEPAHAQVPLPTWVRSVEVVDDGTPLHRAPDTGSPRAGVVARGTRLGFGRRLFGPGCATGAWIEVGRDGPFACERHLRFSPEPPLAVAQPVVPEGATLPFQYVFIAVDAAPVFAHPTDVYDGDWIASLGRGWGLVERERRIFGDVEVVRTRRGWIEAGLLRRAVASDFEGVAVGEVRDLDFGWVLRDRAPLWTAARGGRIAARASWRQRLGVRGPVGGRRVPVEGGLWIDDADLARPTVEAVPEAIGSDEVWIDVDVAEQVLVVWRGARPIWATLVSTGRPGPETQTPTGLHRVWVKLATSDMDDVERQDVEHNYAIEQVPWVQYFAGDAGLHAAFWHDDFGRPRSRGCVNLSPRDARRLFELTSPALPAGWQAVFPSDAAPGTWVRVRGDVRRAPRAAAR
ncbi:MAG: L,D-transpeptidase [Myxococcales bacterium]|nr:L,D-transpeptidase [Myxococcales bacterium]